MKLFVVVIALCALTQLSAGAAVKPKKEEQIIEEEPKSEDQQAQTLRLEQENNGLDKYNFAYETSNGISRSETGELKTIDDQAAIVVQGSTAWTAPDGRRYEIVFTADELGYHPLFRVVES